ncbi:tetratricopeptide repeat protein [Sphingomonas populi]|uniref:Tetratricopeptide repeat protein n=1 Tax=Sphingomonas populi TaxID=2484750 RepID=A0A4Q6Y7Z7_9SPHN|nr:tetratricopeptide repeat protein [Sphingomonas populi]RZF65727.1 tetratricopeptide repeat protein [Sphingomonas populi]
MAVPPNTDAAFLREVDEELRRDQLAGAWQRYGRIAIIAIIVALAAFGGYLLWRSHQQSEAGEKAEALQKVYDGIAAKDAATKPLPDLATASEPGYRALAKFTQADVLLQKNDLPGAAKLFAAIAADTGVGQPFRDLALIRETSAEFDTLKPELVVSRLRDLARPSNAWFGSAGELVAMAYLRMNKPELAGPLFAQIARNEDVPGTIRQRAVQMTGVLGVDAVDQGEDKKAK